jgi:hypothetical protein
MIEKLRLSLEILFQQLKKNNFPVEILVVDWNPPKDVLTIYEELKNILPQPLIRLKVIEVGSDIHNQYEHSNLRPMVAEVAANVGIRRAEGRFVVLKAADSFYSDSLVKFIAKKNLNENIVYRVDRVDIKAMPRNSTKWEEDVSKNIVYRFKATGEAPHVEASGDFMMMTKSNWHSIRGFPETSQVISLGCDGEALYASLGMGLKEVRLDDPHRVYKLTHGGLHASRVKIDSSKKLEKIKSFSKKIQLYRAMKFSFAIMMGILNMPHTTISGIRVRSYYRYQVVCWLRRYLPFIYIKRQENWGLAKLNLKTITVFDGLGDEIK